MAVFSFLVMPFDTNILWAGTEIGLFVSDDNGNSWQYADNGLPAAGIFEMKIVDGQIVVATQGRGIWTVDLPELVGYQPPVATLSPRLNQMAMSPAGVVLVHINLRSAYDATVVSENGAIVATLAANTQPFDTTLVRTVTDPGRLRFEVTSVKDLRQYKSAVREVDVFPTESQISYADNFNNSDTQDNYTGQNYSQTTSVGLISPAIHSTHSYADGEEMIVLLKTPIKVAENNAIISYDDIALVEPGDPGTVYGDQAMWDYVVVEGTTDGLSWEPLIDGYDARANPAWLTAYQNRSEPQSSLFVTHNIDLLETFSAGEVIFVRFRLYADQAANGWGWVIDNLDIQQGVSGPVDIPSTLILSQNKPNPFPSPFNPVTTIPYTIPEKSQVTLKIYDILGREVVTLVDAVQDKGNYSPQWDGKNTRQKTVASGVYIYRIQTGNEAKSKRMLLIR